MSSARAERLVNLVLCLLSTRQFLSAERIRATVPGYADAPNDDAFFRMFERDKSELRELGVPLETGRNSGFDTTDGYRIARQDYELGEVDLEPDEAAAVALASRLWDSPELAGAAHGAVLKLRAAGVEVDEDRSRAGAAPGARGRAGVRAVAGGGPGGAGRQFPPPPRRADGRGDGADRGAVGRRVVRGGAGTSWVTTGTGTTSARSGSPASAGPVTPSAPPAPSACRRASTCSRWSTARSGRRR